ncbi:hypothetical protein CWC15_10295 [Pseudoalteromonas spongiae]|nr:hypothetical protein CWC15_10295 [Pseudoalteromonas spongiae]
MYIVFICGVGVNMKIVIVSGSGRPNSNSLQLASKISEHLARLDIECDLVDLSEMTRLLHHYEANDDEVLNKQKALLLEKLYSSDGIVIVAPEWGGMLPPVLHNFLLLSAYGSASGFPLGHKPALAIGISTSGGGHNPVSLLKGYSAKNSHLVWLPFHVIINNVDEFIVSFAEKDNALCSRQKSILSRLEVGLHALVIYAKQLAPIRNELTQLSIKHPFGQ